MSLRNFFAAVGLCESSEDLARKPELIRQIIDYSTAATSASPPDAAYKERLRCALDEAVVASLDQLIAQKVVVCLDQRLSKLDAGFWDNSIFSVFYNRNGKKILGLYDNGKSPEDTGFFDASVTEYSGRAIDHLCEEVLGERNIPAMVLGRPHQVGKTTIYHWTGPDDFETELKKNPSLKEPPVSIRATIPRSSSSRPSG